MPRLFAAFAAMVLAGGLAEWAIESGAGNPMFGSFADAVWWAVVTIATVGYGDKYPVSGAGRAVAGVLILCAIVILALLSGTLASIFVERRIREGKGLQEVGARNHLVICGWGPDAAAALESVASSGARGAVVLLCSMQGEAFEALKAKYPELDLHFVRGDVASEASLKKAGVAQARAVIAVPELSGEDASAANADERTILCVLAAKAVNPDVHVTALIQRRDNLSHLKRARADSVLVAGEHAGFLLASASVAGGLPQAARELLSADPRAGLREAPIPAALVGRSFAELSRHFIAEGLGVPVGVVSRDKQVSLEDLVSDDSSAIDNFIKRKFQEAEIDLADEEGRETRVNLNPGADYQVQAEDLAFVVGEARR